MEKGQLMEENLRLWKKKKPKEPGVLRARAIPFLGPITLKGLLNWDGGSGGDLENEGDKQKKG